MNTLYLVRHAENPANLTLEFACRNVDYPLTEKGILQARQTGDYFRGLDIDEIYASPLKRARQTAEIIAAAIGLDVQVMEAFREIQVGDLEGQPVSMEAWDYHDRIFLDWVHGNPDPTFPNGDSYHTLWGRLRAGLLEITAGKDGKKIVIVGHGGQFMATLKDLCPGVDMDPVLNNVIGNCSVTRVEMERVGDELRGTLLEWSSVAHLHGPAARLVAGVPEKGTFFTSKPSE